MKNIFKENKRLLEENKLLKAQIEALNQFKTTFDEFYHEISGPKIFTNNYDNKIVLKGSFMFDEMTLHIPIEECKRRVAYDISKHIEPFIEFDMIDGPYNKELVGTLNVITK